MAASKRIKGITIEIGGKTEALKTALKEVDSALGKTQSALKDVNKLLKLDPKNTELLAQKQRLLKDAVAETKEKLETLKEADRQAKAQLESGALGQDKYDALQREIVETQERLKELAKEADTTGNAIKSAGEKMQKTGESISDAGKKLMPASGAVIGLGAVAVKAAADFDASMSRVAAVSGATGEDFDKLKMKAREMGEKTKFSASESADAMNYMAMAGWKTEDMLSGIEGVMNLAAASGEDLAHTSDIVTDALTAFGLSAKDSGHFADVLAAASSNANTNVSMMGETFKYAAPVAGALGYTIEDTAEVIGLMANAGIKSSQAGTALRAMMTKLQGEITLTGAAFGEVTIQTTNADGSMRELGDIMTDLRGYFSQMSESEAAASAEMLVGKNAMSGFLAVMQAAPADIKKLNGAISSCSGKTKEMATVMQGNLSGQLTQLKSMLQELAISFGTIIIPAISKAVDWVKKLVDKFNSMSEGTRKVIVVIGGIVAAAGPLLLVVGKGITLAGSVVKSIGILSTTLHAVKAAGAAAGAGVGLFSGPLLPIIGIIAAVVAAGVLLYKNWDKIKEKAAALGKWISEKWSVLKEKTSEVWNNIKTAVSDKWNDIKTKTSETVENVKAKVKEGWEDLKEKTAEKWKSIKSEIEKNGGGIKGIVKTCLENVRQNWQDNFEKINKLTGGKLGETLNTAKEKLGAIKDAFVDKLSAARDFVRGAIDKIKSFFNFRWELPKIKLPHFSITGKFNLMPPQIPHFNVKWYKKAMDEAYILRGANIFGNMGSKFLGGGEAGSEMVVGTRHMMGMIKEAASINNNMLIDALDRQTGKLVGMMSHYFPQFANTQIVLDSGALVGELTPLIDRQLGTRSMLRERGL